MAMMSGGKDLQKNLFSDTEIIRSDGTLCTGHGIPPIPDAGASGDMVIVNGTSVYLLGGVTNSGQTGEMPLHPCLQRIIPLFQIEF